jgi:hypothetical protein
MVGFKPCLKTTSNLALYRVPFIGKTLTLLTNIGLGQGILKGEVSLYL